MGVELVLQCKVSMSTGDYEHVTIAGMALMVVT
jgi:hypothetical protein